MCYMTLDRIRKRKATNGTSSGTDKVFEFDYCSYDTLVINNITSSKQEHRLDPSTHYCTGVLAAIIGRNFF